MKASLKRWIGRVPDVSAVIQRFPVPVFLMGIFTLIIIFRDHLGDEEPLVYLCGGLILASYFLVSWVVGREGQNKPYLLPAQIVFAVLICLLAWYSEKLRFHIPMAIAGAILILGNAVRWRRGRDDLHVWDYTHKLWTGAVFAAVGSWIFVMGTLAIMFALKSLFGVNIDKLTEYVILPVGLGFLAPLYWMSTLPPANEDYQELHDNPGFVSKAVAFMGTWLLTPLLLIYALILLAYGLKIIMAGSLPKGEIAQLTTPFLIIGTLNWLVLESPFVQKSSLARFFRKVWFWLSIPVAILLAIAVTVRISNYGLTVERVLLLMGVIWALGIGLWFSFMKEARRDIRYIPGFAGVLFLVASVSASFVSLNNQDKRLGHYIKKAGIISADNKLIKDAKITDMAAARKAKGALQYLFRQDGHEKIRKHLAEWGMEGTPLNQSKLVKTLSLENVELNLSPRDSIYYDNHSGVVSIAGYDHLIEVQHLNFYKDNAITRTLASFESGELIVEKGQIYLIKKDGDKLFSFDVQAWGNALTIVDQEFIIDDPNIVLFQDEGRELALHVKVLNKWNDDNLNGQFYVLSKGFRPKT